MLTSTTPSSSACRSPAPLNSGSPISDSGHQSQEDISGKRTMSELVAPHGGGSLKPLLVHAAERGGALKRAATLRSIPLSSREVSDLFMLGMGAYTPLDGFMGHDDWKGSVTEMRLAGGVFWPIPIT